MQFQSIQRQLRGMDKAVRTGTVRALNKALASTKSKVIKELRSETGLKTEVIKTRVMGLKANADKMTVSVNIATKVGVALRHFSPSQKKVRVKHRTGGKARLHYGVSIRLGTQGRVLAPGAFFIGKNGIVVGRKAAYTSGSYTTNITPRKPLIQLRTNVFLDSARGMKDTNSKYLGDRFNTVVTHEINYAVSQRFSSNK